MLRRLLFFAWLVPPLVLLGLALLADDDFSHRHPGLGDNLLYLTMGLLLCHLTTEFVVYCRKTERPAWLMIGWASAFFLIIGVPLFASGSIAKNAMEAEKDRWMLGFVFRGIGIVLLVLAVTCFLYGWLRQSGSRVQS